MDAIRHLSKTACSKAIWHFTGVFFALCLGLLANVPAWANTTVATIQARGVLRCGANAITGYAIPDDTGHWRGFMVDLCRAVAAVVLGDSERFEILPVESQTRFKALQSGDIDLLVDASTITLDREADLNVTFPGIWLYDGQAFLTRRTTGWKSIKDVGSATICVADGTTSRRNIEQYLARQKLTARLIVAQSDEGAWTSYLKGRCDLFTSDRFGLMVRSILHSGAPNDHRILPEVISKEPLGPAVRSGDAGWTKLVRWTIAVLVAAEEHGLTSDNIATIAPQDDQEALVLTGQAPDHADVLGVSPGWARRAIQQVGNYGEIFDRHLGAKSMLKAERGQNAQWNQGGLLYAPPIR